MANAVGIRDIFVEANGLRHHLLARGSPGSPVVLMIHGLTGQAHNFDRIAERLAGRFHVYCIDVRGRGETEWGPPDGYHTDNYVSDLEAVRDALGLHTFAIVGTSMGGIIGMYYAARHGEHVQRLVLNDIGPEIDPRGLERIRSYVQDTPLAFADLKAVAKWYKQHYGPMLGHLSDDEVAEFARWHVRRSDTGLYVWKMDPAIRSLQAPPPSGDPWETFRAVACPILVIRGAESDVLSAETARRMQAEGKDCRVVEVPDVGHAPVLTEKVALEALERFLLEQRPAS